MPACSWSFARVNARRRPNCAQVICIDNFFTGSKDNVKHLIGKPNFELMRCAPYRATSRHEGGHALVFVTLALSPCEGVGTRGR